MSDYVGPAAVAATVRADPPAGGAWVHDDSRNPWRYKLGQPDVIEVQLVWKSQEIITIIDARRHAEVKGFLWFAQKCGNVFYAVANLVKSDGKQTRIGMHRVLNDDLPIGDHVGRNGGLDNRDMNIRNGSGRVNAQNRTTKKNNVSCTENRRRWVAHWTDAHSVKRAKVFTWSKNNYAESMEEKRIEAEAYAAKMKASVMEELLSRQPERKRNEVSTIKPPVPRKISNSGIPGLSYFGLGTNSARVTAYVNVNGHLKAKTRSFSTFQNEELVLNGTLTAEDFAVDAVMTWMDEKIPELEKLPPGPGRKRRKIAVVSEDNDE